MNGKDLALEWLIQARFRPVTGADWKVSVRGTAGRRG